MVDNKEKSRRFVVPEEEDGSRIDRLVQVVAGVSRKEARVWIGSGRVRAKGRVVKILAKRFPAGTQLEVAAAADEAPRTRAKSGHRHHGVEVLYLDRWMVAVQKPSGLLSEHDRFGGPSLETVVPKLLSDQGERDRIWLVHRLDAVTSGVVILGRTPQATRHFNEVFREKKAQKVYLGLASGRLRKNRVVSEPIVRVKGTKHGVGPDGKPAETHFSPMESTRGGSLVRALPATGRTHQIRVHLAHLGMPLLGDRLYGGPMYWEAEQRIPVKRAMLHALGLTVPHPKTGESVELRAAPPEDFVTLAQKMGEWSIDMERCLNC